MPLLDEQHTRIAIAVIVLGGVAGGVFGARYMRDFRTMAKDAERVVHATRAATEGRSAYVPSPQQCVATSAPEVHYTPEFSEDAATRAAAGNAPAAHAIGSGAPAPAPAPAQARAVDDHGARAQSGADVDRAGRDPQLR